MVTEALFIAVGLGSIGLVFTFAYFAEDKPILRMLFQLVLTAALVLMGIAGVGAALVAGETVPSSDRITEALAPAMPTMALAFGLMAVAGLTLLAAPVRRLVALVLPIDPHRLVHLLALQFALLTIGFGVVIGAVMGLVADDPVLQDLLVDGTQNGDLLPLWAQAAAFMAIAVLGVGFGIARDWRATLARLGLTRRFHFGWWAAATAAGVAAAFLVQAGWQEWRPETLDNVNRLSDLLFGPYLDQGMAGALTIGLSAGLGEEILFRGAAQPRLGFLFTSLLFMVVHTQYTVSPALLQVLVIALLLATVRSRANTTTAIAVHATYNFALVMLAIYAPELGP